MSDDDRYTFYSVGYVARLLGIGRRRLQKQLECGEFAGEGVRLLKNSEDGDNSLTWCIPPTALDSIKERNRDVKLGRPPVSDGIAGQVRTRRRG